MQEILHFKGTWRNYQQRVLEQGFEHLKDNKLHLVAAPGSGKTTLGIEFIRRVGHRALVLVPSIAIREQWISRLIHGFMRSGFSQEDYLSTSLKDMKDITVVTYQALHSAMTRQKAVLKDEDDEAEEVVDFSTFQISAAIKEHNIQTICLDEAHHLRSEWWRSLEQVVDLLPPNHVSIALTATPPYDSGIQEWERYIGLCGEIDQEIFTPELVQEGSLCPHQDYVYFSYPTEKEKQFLGRQKQIIAASVDTILADPLFKVAVASHRGLKDYKNYEFLENPAYFTAFLLVMKKLQIAYPHYLNRLLGVRFRLPHLKTKHIETFLQNFLFEDTGSYSISKEDYRRWMQLLKSVNGIQRNKVILGIDRIYCKKIMASASKLESINVIVNHEYSSLKADLRLLVLCDFIRNDQLPFVNTAEEIISLGAIPVFEVLRRQDRSPKLAVLTGSTIILPVSALSALEALLPSTSIKYNSISTTDYMEVLITGDRHKIVAVITDLFERGYFEVLIGTKSLLGEGWDSPCINSLILATYVGSFMLSNQMRGRGIRIDSKNPNKVSNIWHLVCARAEDSEETVSEDFLQVEKRFQTFLGLHDQEPRIESGLGRLSAITLPLSRDGMEKINRKMLALSQDRKGLQKRWQETLMGLDPQFEVQENISLKDKPLPTAFTFTDFLAYLSLYLILAQFIRQMVRSAVYFILKGSLWESIFVVLFTVGGCVAIYKLYLFLYRKVTKLYRYKKVAKAVQQILIEKQFISPQSRATVKETQAFFIDIRLENASTKEKSLYAQCIQEVFGEIDNQRYFLMKRFFRRAYYPVPELFGKSKTDALLFLSYMTKAVGKIKLVYSRNPQGRRLLLRARKNAYINRNNQAMMCNKRIKSRFE